jgi:hypothetical protein
LRPLAGILLVAVLAAAPADHAAAAAAGAAPLPTAALLLFLDAESEAGLPAPPALLRETARRQLVAALAAPGRRLCAGDEVESLLAAARMRSSRGLSEALLAAVAARCEAEELIVARLAIARGKLFIALRGIDPASGRLLRVAVAEQDLGGGDDWRRALGDAALELGAGWGLKAAESPAGEGLLVLPARGAGVEPLLLSLIEESLLAALLAQGRWQIIEPALSLSALREAGLHPAALGSAPRRALAASQGATSLVRLQVIGDSARPLVGREAARGAEASLVLDDDEEPEGGRAGSAAARRAGLPLYAVLEWVDAESGLLRRVAEQSLPAAAATGSFGRPRQETWSARIAQLTAPLAAALIDTGRADARP